MLRDLVRRLLLTVPVHLGVATLVFALIQLVPGDPAQSMLGEGAYRITFANAFPAALAGSFSSALDSVARAASTFPAFQ
jgi:ABC-type dipeptide/oligopeptide/nickel transport system permease component